MTKPRQGANDEGVHLWEGLEHLVDMLALADPRRSGPRAPGSPVFHSVQEWRSFCLDVLRKVEGTRPHLSSAEEAETAEASLAKLRRLVES